ncbi:MAG: guanylate kinase [Actinomycetota bacterium]|nr:guanylate kinase [Actinomycetota bacterium]
MASGRTESVGRLFVVSGPSGAGKGTVVRGVLQSRPDVFLSVSATTRPARAGEIDGVDYHFVSREDFARMREQGEFLEWAQVYDNFYGTPREPIDRAAGAGRDVIAELDIQGAMMVKRSRPDAVLIFIEPPSLEELAPRLRGRGTEDANALSRRLQAAYEEIKKKEAYDHVVVNDALDEAVASLLRILEA